MKDGEGDAIGEYDGFLAGDVIFMILCRKDQSRYGDITSIFVFF